MSQMSRSERNKELDERFVRVGFKWLPDVVLPEDGVDYTAGAGCAGIEGLKNNCVGLECSECALSARGTNAETKELAVRSLYQFKSEVIGDKSDETSR